MTHLKLHLLGPPRVDLNGEPAHISRRKAMALLAYLTVEHTRHSREKLVTLLSPEFEPSRASRELRRTLWVLNSLLGEGLVAADRETIGLNPEISLQLDVDEFRRLLAECEGHDHPSDAVCPECVSLLANAVALYRDDFMAGFALPECFEYEEWQFFQTQELRQALASALQRLAHWYSDQKAYEEAIPYSRRWLALDLLHEPAHRHLMALYARAGQTAAALRQYALCEETLAEELGVSPAAETTTLYQRIRSGEDVSESVQAVPHNLPPQTTPFVGRTEELARIADRLDNPDCRLLTLVGPGGIGKTRLAIQAAQEIIDDAARRARFAHGVYFVPLTSVTSADALVPIIASALNLSFHGEVDPRDQLLAHLREKAMLLVFDNFEQLLSPSQSPPERGKLWGADLVGAVLTAAPKVKVLVTSRAALNLREEWFHPVDGMCYPTDNGARSLEGYSALALFAQSARRARPGFSLEEERRWAVRICQLVEGMPLAIELAATWLKVLSPAKIAGEIESGLDILSTSLRDVSARHRSMRTVFDHSWRLLAESEQELLRRLSVFRRDFRLSAAEAVGGTTLASLAGLVEKSLLQSPAADRYQMHELLRQYAGEKLRSDAAENENAHDAHCAYYCEWLQTRAADLKGPRNRAAMAQIAGEIEEVRAAWTWAAERGNVVRLDQALEALCLFYESRGRYEDGQEACRIGAEYVQKTASGEALRLLTRILTWQGVFNGYLGNHEVAGRLTDQSLSLVAATDLAGYDTRAERAFALREMGRIEFYAGDYDRGKPALERSLALYQELGDRWGAASTLYVLGQLCWRYGASEEARQAYTASLVIQKALGDRRGMADSLNGLCAALWAQGKFEEAERAVRQCIAVHQVTGRPIGLPRGFGDLGLTLYAQGKFSGAQAALEEALAVAMDQGALPSAAHCHAVLANTLIHLGSYREARAHSQTGLELGQETNNPKGIGVSLFALGCLALAEDAYAESERLLRDAITVYDEFDMRRGGGWFLAGLGYANRGLFQRSEAKSHLAVTLRLAVEAGEIVTFLLVLPAAALLLADEGDPERAVEVYALASRYPFVANSRWIEDVAGRHIAAIGAHLPPEVVAAAEERGRARDLEATGAELLAEFQDDGSTDASGCVG